MVQKVLIVGAGVSGLTTLKECLSKGLEAEIFEAAGHSGGIWRYTEPDASGSVQSSVYHGCVFNSCRDTSCFSDFPMDPSRYPVYLGHAKFAQYLDEYSAFFDLDRHVSYRTKVVRSEQTAQGGWKVTFEREGRVEEGVWDAVFACTGHLSDPSVPDFEGLGEFKGEFLHSHVYRRPAPFEGKKVAVIGMGSSAVDIASEISPQTDACHVITRTGGWIFPRFVLGKPLEAWDSRIATYLPSHFSQWLQTVLLNMVQGKLPAEIQPKHRILEANPTIRSDFVEKINLGSITPHRASIERFTEDGILLTNGTKLQVDTVIASTGYHINYPYLPSDSYRATSSAFIDSSNNVDLYQLILPQTYRNLFFIGLVESAGPGMPIYEMQARYSVGLLTGTIPYPTPTEHAAWSHAFQTGLKAKYVQSDRHTISAEQIPYLDGLAVALDAQPTLGKLLKRVVGGNPWTGLKLLSAVYMDVSSSGQWRLFGRDACADLAESSVLRIAAGKGEMSEGEKRALKVRALAKTDVAESV